MSKNKMIVYHQKINEGTLPVYLGEDAYPYNKDGILIVADGLGGRGGFPHTKFKKNILTISGEELCDLIVSTLNPDGLYDIQEDFKAYVKDSFKEIIECREIYGTPEYNYRHSGYFASRLVAITTAFCVNYDPVFSKDALFEKLADLELEEDVPVYKDSNEAIKDYANKLCAKVKETLTVFCDVIGLEHEAVSASMYLLPTTLMLTLTKESQNKKGEKVMDAVYVWAGDCRSYVWDESGLKQVTDDHEEVEVMYNLISLSKEFYFDSKVLRVKTPCLIINSSDGCYKCESYLCAMDMEDDILKAIAYDLEAKQEEIVITEEIVEKDDGINTADELKAKYLMGKTTAPKKEPEQKRVVTLRPRYVLASEQLSKVYFEKGKHDDSNTMSMLECGEIKDIVNKRLLEIKDAKVEIQTLAEKFGGVIYYKGKKQQRELERREIVEEAIADYLVYENAKDSVRKIMISSSYAPYLKAMDALSPEASEEEKEAVAEKYTQRYWRVNKKSFANIIWENEETRATLPIEIVQEVENTLAQDLENNKEIDEAINNIGNVIKGYYKNYNKYLLIKEGE